MPVELENKKCVPCSIGDTPLNHNDIMSFMDLVSEEWEVINDVKLQRTFKFKNFKEALEFTNKLGSLAEDEGHHPDIALSWGKVMVSFTTHKIHGLSENDFIMAMKTDKL